MKIIKVEPTEKYFSVTWMLGSRCNYDCMYCRPELHDMTSRPHDLETMQQVWRNIHEKTQHRGLPYKINFTGGEVTANKNFLPLIKWLRSAYNDVKMIVVTTNGSASLSYYKKLCSSIEAISFSTHSEYMNEQEFFSKIEQLDPIMVRPVKSLHVNIMDEFWNQDRIEIYKKWLKDRGISHSVNEINYADKTRSVPVFKGKSNLGH